MTPQQSDAGPDRRHLLWRTPRRRKLGGIVTEWHLERKEGTASRKNLTPVGGSSALQRPPPPVFRGRRSGGVGCCWRDSGDVAVGLRVPPTRAEGEAADGEGFPRPEKLAEDRGRVGDMGADRQRVPERFLREDERGNLRPRQQIPVR